MAGPQGYPPPQGYPGYPPPGVATMATPQYSGWWRRFAAIFIDGIILFVVYFIINLIVGIAMPAPAVPTSAQLAADPNAANAYLTAAAGHATVVLAIVWPITLIIGTLYFAIQWSRSGQTLGNRVMGIRVIRENGELLGVGGGILRYIVGMVILDDIVFGLPIGWLWAAWDSKKQAWHDKISGTIVVRV